MESKTHKSIRNFIVSFKNGNYNKKDTTTQIEAEPPTTQVEVEPTIIEAKQPTTQIEIEPTTIEAKQHTTQIEVVPQTTQIEGQPPTTLQNLDVSEQEQALEYYTMKSKLKGLDAKKKKKNVLFRKLKVIK